MHLAGGGAEDGGEGAVAGSGAGGDGVYPKGGLCSECCSCCRGLSIRGGARGRYLCTCGSACSLCGEGCQSVSMALTAAASAAVCFFMKNIQVKPKSFNFFG